MKNKRSKLLVCVIVVLIAGLIASIVAIVNLTEQVESLQETVNNQFNTMNANINSIYSNVDNALKKQTSIVSSVEENKGNLNESDLTVPVSLKIVPKDIAEDTNLSVEIGDKIYPLSKSGATEYSATVSVPLFNEENAVSVAEKYAEENGFKVEKYPADWKTYGKSAGPRRNKQMAEVSDYVICFWDEESKGTKSMIDYARKCGKPVKIKKI